MLRLVLYLLFPPAAILFPPKRRRTKNKYVRAAKKGIRFTKAVDRMSKPRRRKKWW